MGRRRPGTGSVEIRGGSYELRYFREDGKRARKVLGRTEEMDEAEARRRADDLLFAISPAFAGSHLTVARLVDDLAPVLRSFLVPMTADGMEAIGRRAARFFGARPARAVNVSAAQDFMASLDGLSNNTRRDYRARLVRLWKLGHERGLLGPENPWRSVRVPRYVEPAIEPLRRADAERLAPFLEPEVADLVRFLCETGLRRGEAFRLTRSDVRDGRVHVRESKNGRPRATRLSAFALPVVARILMRSGPGHLFRELLDGAGYQRTTDRLSHACRLAGLPHMTLHCCRHGFACRLADAGCTERDIAAALGHRNEETVRRYTADHHPDAAADRAIERLERHEASSAKRAE